MHSSASDQGGTGQIGDSCSGFSYCGYLTWECLFITLRVEHTFIFFFSRGFHSLDLFSMSQAEKVSTLEDSDTARGSQMVCRHLIRESLHKSL